jgi:chromosome partitioning protein
MDNWPEDKHIIIDVGGFDSNLNRAAIYISDIIITPAVDRVTEMAGLYKFHQIIEELSEKMKTDIIADILLNDVSPTAKDFSVMEELVAKLDHFRLMETVVAHRADFYKTMEEGKGVTELEGKGQKTILFGVTYALLDLAEEFPQKLEHTIIMETGGMKGKRERCMPANG